MKAADIITPEPLLAPIANQGLRNTLPDNATGTNYASIEEGFPEITMKAPKDGGLPPWGQDFNGMFYLMSSQTCFLQNGGLITFDQAVSDKIDGYPQGAILDYVTPENTYVKVKSLIDDNTYNFVTTPSYIDGEHWEEVTLAATTSWGDITGNIENQTDLQTVLNNQLNKTQLSNCILEIPQNINLVDNGTNIIIKAGTIGIKPNGFEADGSTPKFDYITVTADITLENNQTTTVMLGLNGAQNVYRTPINRCFSGPTAPESSVNLTIWYDTSTNLVKRYVNSAWSVENFTLPLGILNYTASGTPGSIEQVFNGIGYIGNTVFVNPDVKVLITTAVNEDGNKVNTEYTTDSVYLGSTTNPNFEFVIALTPASFNTEKNCYVVDYSSYSISPVPPENINKWLNSQNGLFYILKNGMWLLDPQVHLGFGTISNGVITEFNQYGTISVPDDQTVLHKYGNETAYGDKTFVNDVNINGLLTINSDTLDIANTVAPSTNQAYVLADIRDKNNVIAGSVRYIEQTSGNKYMEVLCGKTLNGATSYSQFLVGKTVSGRNFVQAPASDIINSVITTTGISKAANGYLKLGNGIIIQWGGIGAVTVNQNLTTSFSTPFTVAPKVVVSINGTWGYCPVFSVAAVTISNFTVHLSSNESKANGCGGFWFAIGY